MTEDSRELSVSPVRVERTQYSRLGFQQRYVKSYSGIAPLIFFTAIRNVASRVATIRNNGC